MVDDIAPQARSISVLLGRPGEQGCELTDHSGLLREYKRLPWSANPCQPLRLTNTFRADVVCIGELRNFRLGFSVPWFQASDDQSGGSLRDSRGRALAVNWSTSAAAGSNLRERSPRVIKDIDDCIITRSGFCDLLISIAEQWCRRTTEYLKFQDYAARVSPRQSKRWHCSKLAPVSLFPRC
jgi:hypothetical protein